MYRNAIRNILLSVVGLLLVFNLVVLFSQPVHAVGKSQFKAVALARNSSSGLGDTARRQEDARIVQETLDQESAQGWEYVGNLGAVLIFKK